MIAIRSGCPVVVHADRVAAAERAIELGADVIVSDDGLQHYRLDRNYEILVVDGARKLGNGQLLPAGPLREPAARLQSVDQVLVQQPSDDGFEWLRRASDPLPLAFRLKADSIRSLDNSARRNIEKFAGTSVHAVAGIGNPERFFRLLETHNIDVIRHPLPDHANIRQRDLDFDDDLAVLMTEKDAVKCRGLDAGNCWYVPVEVAIDNEDAGNLLERIVNRISPDKGGVAAQERQGASWN
jgi:tetraacyldisaccharide 4'-kinase